MPPAHTFPKDASKKKVGASNIRDWFLNKALYQLEGNRTNINFIQSKQDEKGSWQNYSAIREALKSAVKRIQKTNGKRHARLLERLTVFHSFSDFPFVFFFYVFYEFRILEYVKPVFFEIKLECLWIPQFYQMLNVHADQITRL